MHVNIFAKEKRKPLQRIEHVGTSVKKTYLESLTLHLVLQIQVWLSLYISV